MSSPQKNIKVNQIGDDEIDLIALMSTIWRGKWWVVLCTFLAIIMGCYYAFFVATPVYTARAVIALETQKQQVLDFKSVLSGGAGGSEGVNTEVEVIMSRILISRLVDELDLVNDPEFNGQLREPNKLNPKVFIRSFFKEPAVPTLQQIKDNVIDNTIGAISVSNVRQSLVFNLSVTTTNATKSALIANTLASIYIDDTLDKKRVATERASLWLSEKVVELKAELEASEIAVTSFKDDINVVSADALLALSRQLKDLRQRIEDVRNTKNAVSSRLDKLKVAQKVQDLDMKSVSDLASDTLLTQLASEGAREAFDRRLNDLILEVQAEVNRADQQLRALLKSELKFRDEIETQSNDLVQLQQLTREAEANGLLYQSFLTRLKETSIQKGLQQPDSRMLSQAVPRPPSAPRKSMILVLFALLGAIFGCGYILLREMQNNSFRSAEDLEAYAGVNVLGSIPSVKTKDRLGVLEYAIDKPTSAFAEAIRNLRTSVLMSNVDKQPQVIMSTSSVPGEGKTTQSLTLAQNMAGLGKKILIVEGDIRKCIFKEYFDTDARPGFLSVMSGAVELEDAVFKHEKMGVDLLFAENSGANAADIFSSNSFAEFVEMLRDKYDYIVIDTAPVLAVPDARIVSDHVDAIIYSVLWDSTTKAQVKDGLEMFSSIGKDVTGLVLSNVNVKQLKKYGYHGSYSFSGYYES